MKFTNQATDDLSVVDGTIEENQSDECEDILECWGECLRHQFVDIHQLRCDNF